MQQTQVMMQRPQERVQETVVSKKQHKLLVTALKGNTAAIMQAGTDHEAEVSKERLAQAARSTAARVEMRINAMRLAAERKKKCKADAAYAAAQNAQ
jgi:hypothetical protein